MQKLRFFAVFFVISLTNAIPQLTQPPFPLNLNLELLKNPPSFLQSTTTTTKEEHTSYLGLSDYNVNDDVVVQSIKKSSEKPVLATMTTTLEEVTTERIVSTSNVAELATTDMAAIEARFGPVTPSSKGTTGSTTKTTTAATSTKKPVIKKKECGVQVTSNRIVGGNETEIDEFPFLALLYYKSPKNDKVRYKCGGSLINTRTILTAAHCVEGELGKTLDFVRLGEWNTKTEKDCISIGFNDEDCADPPIDFKVKSKVKS